MPTKLSELNNALVSCSYTTEFGLNVSHSQEDFAAAAFETANGENIVLYYSPACQYNMNETSYFLASMKVCVNMFYDLNGTKGPNTIGKDMGFMSILYPADSVVVAPLPQKEPTAESYTISTVGGACSSVDPDYRLPSREELMAIYVNNEAYGGPMASYWSSNKQVINGTTVQWLVNIGTGANGWNTAAHPEGSPGLCIKR